MNCLRFFAYSCVAAGFVILFPCSTTAATESERKAAFYSTEGDMEGKHDGKWKLEDYMTTLSFALGADSVTPEKTVEIKAKATQMFKSMDTNNDDVVTEEEFLAAPE